MHGVDKRGRGACCAPYLLQMAQQLRGRRDVREQHPIAQPVEGDPEGGEPLRRRAVDSSDAEALRQAVLGGEPVALAAELVVVRQVRSSLAIAPGLDVVGEKAGEPEAVVSEMHPQQETTASGSPAFSP